MTLRTSRAATNTIAKPCVLSSPLDADERRSLKRCERVIARGAKAFIAVGLALSEIKERRLYREEFATFEAYCQARLNCSRSLGYRLITHAAMVIEMGVSPIGDKLGTESQARELARVPREMRKEVLRLADETAEGGPLTARLIRQAAIELGVDGKPRRDDRRCGRWVQWPTERADGSPTITNFVAENAPETSKMHDDSTHRERQSARTGISGLHESMHYAKPLRSVRSVL